MVLSWNLVVHRHFWNIWNWWFFESVFFFQNTQTWWLLDSESFWIPRTGGSFILNFFKCPPHTSLNQCCVVMWIHLPRFQLFWKKSESKNHGSEKECELLGAFVMRNWNHHIFSYCACLARLWLWSISTIFKKCPSTLTCRSCTCSNMSDHPHIVASIWDEYSQGQEEMSLLPSICGTILWCPEFATLKSFC